MKMIYYDLYRYAGSYKKMIAFKLILFDSTFRQIYYYRLYNSTRSKKVIKGLNHFIRKKNGIDLPFSAKIGKGLLLLHPQNITFNSKCVIGNNLTILKGATIGATKDSEGNNLVPIIGDNVYIGINAVVVGNITIGDNSMICANSFVNFDVPNDSIVLGNPGIIHKKKNASKLYIKNEVKINDKNTNEK